MNEPNVVQLYRACEAHLQDALILMKESTMDEREMVRKLVDKTRAAHAAAVGLENLMIRSNFHRPNPSSPNSSTAEGLGGAGQ